MAWRPTPLPPSPACCAPPSLVHCVCLQRRGLLSRMALTFPSLLVLPLRTTRPSPGDTVSERRPLQPLLLLFPLYLTYSVLYLFVFCLLSVSWQREGKSKREVLNESLLESVPPELGQCLAQRASWSSGEGNTFRDYALIGARPGSFLEPSSLRKAWAQERVAEAEGPGVLWLGRASSRLALLFPRIANPSSCPPPPD